MRKAYLGGINPDKVDLALVLPGNRLNSLGNLTSLGITSLDENVSQRQTSLGVHCEVIRRDLIQERGSVLLDEVT